MRPEYETLFEHQDFLMQVLHRVYILCHLTNLKIDPLLDPLHLSSCENWGRIKFNYFVVCNTHSDELQKLINVDIYLSTSKACTQGHVQYPYTVMSQDLYISLTGPQLSLHSWELYFTVRMPLW